MDSQTTLVTPTFSQPHTVLYFDKDSMRNTTIRRANGDIAYTVQSNSDISRVEIWEPKSSAPVATIMFNQILPDTIQFRDAEKVKLNKWLPSRKTFPVKLVHGGQTYEWSADSHRRLALFYPGALNTSPIAWLQRPNANSPRATLSLTPEAMAISETVLAALLVLEQDNRVGYKTYKVAEGRAVLDSGLAITPRAV